MEHNILYVDDDYDDFILFREGFSSVCPDLHIHFLNAPENLQGYLVNADKLPKLIIIDWLKAGENCAVYLEQFQESNFKDIPVILVSGSDVNHPHIWNLGLKGIYMKPQTYDALIEIVTSICHEFRLLNNDKKPDN